VWVLQAKRKDRWYAVVRKAEKRTGIITIIVVVIIIIIVTIDTLGIVMLIFIVEIWTFNPHR
jgi:hypothetical protein